MPSQTTKTSVLARFGTKYDAFLKEHAEDPIDYGFKQLPPGITNGVARLTECAVEVIPEGKTDAGKPRVRFKAVAISPKSVTVNGVRVDVEGTQFYQFVSLFETTNRAGDKTSVQENALRAKNEMGKLGADVTKLTRFVDFEAVAAELEEAKPYFHFSTEASKPTKEFPNERTWTRWGGSKGLEDYAPETGGLTDAEPSANGAAPSANGEAFNEFGGEGDEGVDALVAAAIGGDDDAVNRLRQAAFDAGVPEADVDAAEDWVAVGELLKAARASGPAAGSDSDGEGEGGAEEPAAEPTQAWAPAVEDVYRYSPLDPKTKKPFTDPKTKKEKKPLEVEVTAVDKKTRTVTIRQLDNPKVTYPKVPWEQLKSAE